MYEYQVINKMVMLLKMIVNQNRFKDPLLPILWIVIKSLKGYLSIYKYNSWEFWMGPWLVLSNAHATIIQFVKNM